MEGLIRIPEEAACTARTEDDVEVLHDQINGPFEGRNTANARPSGMSCQASREDGSKKC